MIPFSNEVYFSLFAELNQTFWQANWIGYALAILVVVLAMKLPRIGDRLIPIILAVAWCWTGSVFFGQAISDIFWPAWIFKIGFLVQAALLAGLALIPDPLPLRMTADNKSWTAGMIIAVCLIFFPLLAAQMGHAWPNAQLIGNAPAPIAVFTLAILCLAPGPITKALSVLPAAFLLITAYLALELSIWEDFLLIFCGLVALIMTFRNTGSTRSGRA